MRCFNRVNKVSLLIMEYSKTSFERAPNFAFKISRKRSVSQGVVKTNINKNYTITARKAEVPVQKKSYRSFNRMLLSKNKIIGMIFGLGQM